MFRLLPLVWGEFFEKTNVMWMSPSERMIRCWIYFGSILLRQKAYHAHLCRHHAFMCWEVIHVTHSRVKWVMVAAWRASLCASYCCLLLRLDSIHGSLVNSIHMCLMSIIVNSWIVTNNYMSCKTSMPIISSIMWFMNLYTKNAYLIHNLYLVYII